MGGPLSERNFLARPTGRPQQLSFGSSFLLCPALGSCAGAQYERQGKGPQPYRGLSQLRSPRSQSPSLGHLRHQGQGQAPASWGVCELLGSHAVCAWGEEQLAHQADLPGHPFPLVRRQESNYQESRDQANSAGGEEKQHNSQLYCPKDWCHHEGGPPGCHGSPRSRPILPRWHRPTRPPVSSARLQQQWSSVLDGLALCQLRLGHAPRGSRFVLCLRSTPVRGIQRLVADQRQQDS